MLESVHCPTCSTHYGLKAERVRIGIRRARCFRCSTIFGIEAEVARLVNEPNPAIPEVSLHADDLLDLKSQGAEVPSPAPLVEPEPANEAVPSLTLGDLEGIEEEILAKHAETPATEATAPQEEDDEAGGYRSAKDAIAKLLGGIPAPEPAAERRNFGRTANQMDVEATLDALESTLGGVSTKELETRPIIPPPELTQSELEPVKPMASTLKLTHDEIMSAMKAASLPVPPSSSPKPMQAPKAAPVPQPVRETPPEGEANLLKVQVGQEIYSNVTIDQVTTWIEQGRVQDFHMVARQFSENWIEAGKVPSLRPVFERTRRQQSPAAQQSQAMLLPPSSETAPMKKSLFGGLFNRG